MINRIQKPGQSALVVIISVCLVIAGFWMFRNGANGSAERPESPKSSGAEPEISVKKPSVAGSEQPDLSKLQALSPSVPGDQVQIEKLVSEMSDAELIAALETIWTDDVTAPRNELAIQLLRRWAERSPSAAATWISGKVETATQVEGLRVVAAAWAATDLRAAAQWVRQLTGEQRVFAIVAAGYEAVQSSPREALWLAAELPSSAMRDGLIHNAVGEWVHTDTKAPLAWARRLPKSPIREQVFGAIAVSLSDSMPAIAAGVALEELPAGKQQNDVVISIVQRWAQQNGREAAEWVQSFPEGPLRDQATENVVQLWRDKSPEEAAAWIAQIKDGPFREAALSALAQPAALTFSSPIN